jgi:taurine dioxygenase
MPEAQNNGLEVSNLIGSVGVQIRGIDLSKPISDTTFSTIYDLWLANKIVCFREQCLTPHHQAEFARRFGELDTYPYLEGLTDERSVVPIIKEEGDRDNFGGGWHTDMAYMKVPPKATMLYGIDIPTLGGDTLFSDMCRAYDTLSEQMKRALCGITVSYSAEAVHGPKGYYSNEDLSRRMSKNESMEESEHPLIIQHNETNEEAIYFSAPHVSHFNGMSSTESSVVINFLNKHCLEPELITRIRWKKGTLLIWDNRSLVHTALNDYFGYRREVHRVVIKNDIKLKAGRRTA